MSSLPGAGLLVAKSTPVSTPAVAGSASVSRTVSKGLKDVILPIVKPVLFMTGLACDAVTGPTDKF